MPQVETPSLICTYLDSGAPPGSLDYTTLFLVHGLGYHGGVFKKLLSLAHENNARIVVVNRRDYPGSAPYTEEERAILAKLEAATPGSEDAVVGTSEFMKARARELYDYLVDFVARESTPHPRNKTGGIVICGWSLGATWLSALLTHITSFPVGDVNLRDYVRRFVYDDPSCVCHGYSIPRGMFHPRHDRTLAAAERAKLHLVWIGSYFAHGDVRKDGVAALESRNGLEQPPPTTIVSMTKQELAEVRWPSVTADDGSEILLSKASIKHDVYRSLKDGAFYLRDTPAGASDWSTVEVRWIWCDMSIWEMPWGAYVLRQELEEARAAGKRVREAKFVRFRGANHFAHWDLPEKTMKAFLGEDLEEIV